MTSLQAAIAETLDVHISSRALVDDLAYATFAVWQNNGHDLTGALLHVHRRHLSQPVRDLAGQAYDMVLTVPIVWAAFDSDFAERLRAERSSHSA